MFIPKIFVSLPSKYLMITIEMKKQFILCLMALAWVFACPVMASTGANVEEDEDPMQVFVGRQYTDPTNLLVNPKGKIVASNIELENLIDKLNEVLGE